MGMQMWWMSNLEGCLIESNFSVKQMKWMISDVFHAWSKEKKVQCKVSIYLKLSP